LGSEAWWNTVLAEDVAGMSVIVVAEVVAVAVPAPRRCRRRDVARDADAALVERVMSTPRWRRMSPVCR